MSDSDGESRSQGDKHGSTISVGAALIGNLLIFGAKLFAFLHGGGFGGAHSAMFSETLHSAGDASGQGFLLGGIFHGRKKADKNFPFGYGKARFMWSLLAAGFVFTLGGVAIYHGSGVIAKGTMPHISGISLGVFGLAAVVESLTLFVALRNVWRAKNDIPLFAYVKRFEDPSNVAVILEDSVAVLGIAIALGGIGLTELTANPVYDGVASVIIGILMIGVGVFLGLMNALLLVGRSSMETEAKIKQVLSVNKKVEHIHSVQSMYVGVELVLVEVKVELREEEILKLVNGGNKRSRSQISEPRDIEKFLQLISSVKDEIELEIRRACPEIAFATVQVVERSEVSTEK